MSLETSWYELMYLDEFALNFRNKSVYGWGPKGNNGFKHNYVNSISMFFIIGFSICRIYRILGTTATHDHRSFISFISNIIDYKQMYLI